MKKRVTIYIDDGVWDSLKECAWRARISASERVERLIVGYLESGEMSKFDRAILDDVKEKMRAGGPPMKAKRVEAGKEPVQESIRARYKRLHPKELCPQCHERNRDCKCSN